jgi:hypothetical protein
MTSPPERNPTDRVENHRRRFVSNDEVPLDNHVEACPGARSQTRQKPMRRAPCIHHFFPQRGSEGLTTPESFGPHPNHPSPVPVCVLRIRTSAPPHVYVVVNDPSGRAGRIVGRQGKASLIVGTHGIAVEVRSGREDAWWQDGGRCLDRVRAPITLNGFNVVAGRLGLALCDDWHLVLSKTWARRGFDDPAGKGARSVGWAAWSGLS